MERGNTAPEETPQDMKPEDIANAIVSLTKGVPVVQALADICGGMAYPIALNFAEHLPEEETDHLRQCWATDGPKRAAYLFTLWATREMSDSPLPWGDHGDTNDGGDGGQ